MTLYEKMKMERDEGRTEGLEGGLKKGAKFVKADDFILRNGMYQ